VPVTGLLASNKILMLVCGALLILIMAIIAGRIKRVDTKELIVE
jgi:hypothetical protein